MRKYKSDELVDFKPRSLSSLKYDIDGMLPRSKSGHVVYCIFSRGSLLLITLHLPHLLGRGASQDTFLIKCLRFDCIRNFFEARSFKSFRQDVVYSQPGLRVRVATSDVWLVGWSKFENIYMSIHCTFFFPNLRVKTSPQVLDFGFSIQIDCIWVMAASLTFWHFLLRGRNWFKTRIRESSGLQRFPSDSWAPRPTQNCRTSRRLSIAVLCRLIWRQLLGQNYGRLGIRIYRAFSGCPKKAMCFRFL